MSNTDFLIPLFLLHLLVSIPLKGRTFPSWGFVASCFIWWVIICYLQMQMHIYTYTHTYTYWNLGVVYQYFPFQPYSSFLPYHICNTFYRNLASISLIYLLVRSVPLLNNQSPIPYSRHCRVPSLPPSSVLLRLHPAVPGWCITSACGKVPTSTLLRISKWLLSWNIQEGGEAGNVRKAENENLLKMHFSTLQKWSFQRTVTYAGIFIIAFYKNA